MRTFSKSKLLAFRQCPKRLWLEVHHPEYREDSAATQASFRVGNSVGDVTRKIYDPHGQGVLIDVVQDGFDKAFAKTKAALATAHPIFEAGFSAGGALAFADVMLPVNSGNETLSAQGTPTAWRMVEVKSSTAVKSYHEDDVAVQHHVATTAGVKLQSIALACIDSSWVYPGGGDYTGLLKEHDLTDMATARQAEVQTWISQAQHIVAQTTPPDLPTGEQCDTPYACGFYAHCAAHEPQAQHPVHWLPRWGSSAQSRLLAAQGVIDMRDVPDQALSEQQRLVKHHTLQQSTHFDTAGALSDLKSHTLPLQFLDFETIQFAVPIWAGTRPYQQIPFQFSLHTLSTTGALQHAEFLALDGADPSRRLALALIEDCGQAPHPIWAYNAAFEQARIADLAKRFPDLAGALLAVHDRIVDLLPIARARYYHPSQRGSWSIKRVLPALVPELRYDALDGVQDGGMAMDAYLEAIHPDTTAERRATLRTQLLAYCKLDTYAMVKLWQVFAQRQDIAL